MAITTTEVEAAIKRALLNGEKWEMGDVSSEISLKRLMDLRRELADQNGIQMHVVAFGTPTAEED